MSSCVFCQIIAGTSPAKVRRRWLDAIAIEPLGQVTPGHTLIIPFTHVADFSTNPGVTAVAMERAAEYAQSACLDNANLITSKGRAATQSVFHLHIHVLPRTENDGLALPWHSGKSRRSSSPDISKGTDH